MDGPRKRNITSMSWATSLQRAEWTIPGKKLRRKRNTTSPFSPALDILTRRQAEARRRVGVSGRRRGQPLFDVYKPWRALLASSGLRDLRPHDLPRTLGFLTKRRQALHIQVCRPDSPATSPVRSKRPSTSHNLATVRFSG